MSKDLKSSFRYASFSLGLSLFMAIFALYKEDLFISGVFATFGVVAISLFLYHAFLERKIKRLKETIDEMDEIIEEFERDGK